jgi:hypothetical protein
MTGDEMRKIRHEMMFNTEMLDEAWKDATGLLVGGDPGGVTPETLRRYIDVVDRIARAAVEVVDQATLALSSDRRHHVPEAAILKLREALEPWRKMPEGG